MGPHDARVDLVVPGVQTESALADGPAHAGVGAQLLQLRDHMVLDRLGDIGTEVAVARAAVRGGGPAEPPADRGQGAQILPRAMAPTAPQWECPHRTMSETSSTLTAYSIVAISPDGLSGS